MTDPSLCILTRAGAGFGLSLLQRLRDRGVRPALLCIEDVTLGQRVKMAKYLAKKIGWWDALRYNLQFWGPHLIRIASRGLWCSLPDYSPYCDQIVRAPSINADSVAQRIREMGCKTLVLAQSGIIRQSILSIPNVWIANCHPGRLPEFRGVDCVRWALLARQPVYVTLHLVDEGVDTGRVLREERVHVFPSDTWTSVENRAVASSIELLAEAAVSGPEGMRDESAPQDEWLAEQYHLMPFKEARRLEQEWPDILASLATKGGGG